MTTEVKTKPCKGCGNEFPRAELSSKGFCVKCVIGHYIAYHERALEHYRRALEEKL